MGAVALGACFSGGVGADGADGAVGDPPADVVGYWKFDEGGGDTAYDSSGNENNGTIYGATPAADRFGRTDSAYEFDGVDDYIDVGGIMGGLLDFSVNAWVQTSQLAAGSLRHNDPAIMGTRQRDWLTDDIVLTNYSGNLAWYDELCRTACSGDPHNDYDTGAFIADGGWHQVAVVREGTDLEFYVDGSIVGNYSTETYTVSDNNIEIGRALWDGSLCFEGKIDDVRIYERALSQAEIQALYHEGG